MTRHCRARTFTRDDHFEVLDALSRHYTGEPYSDRSSPSIIVTGSVEGWHTYGEI